MDHFHGNGPYCKILTEKEPIRAQGFAEDWVCHIINYNIKHISPGYESKISKQFISQPVGKSEP